MQANNTSVLQVKSILVNVFGGIVNCETMANGIIKAYTEAHMTVPMVVRLEGRYNIARFNLKLSIRMGWGCRVKYFNIFGIKPYFLLSFLNKAC